MKSILRNMCMALGVLALAGCEVEQIVDEASMPVSENGVYTDNGRFFVAGGDTIYEITGSSSSFQAKVLLKDESCYFGGLTDRGNVLFAPCGRSDAEARSQLVRIDPADPQHPLVSRADFPPFAKPMLLNGMDFGPDGALYISNSLGTLQGDATILRVRIASESPLSFSVTPFLDATTSLAGLSQGGGLFPNGLRFDGNLLYFSRGFDVVRMALRADGSRGPLEVVYRTNALAVIDDFDIAEGYLVMAYTNALGVIAPSLFQNKVVALELTGLKRQREIDMPVPPSSIALRRNTLFGPKTAIVTSYFNGGLYRIKPLL